MAHQPKGVGDSQYTGKVGIDHLLSIQSNSLSARQE
jgi:hypothetical protein